MIFRLDLPQKYFISGDRGTWPRNRSDVITYVREVSETVNKIKKGRKIYESDYLKSPKIALSIYLCAPDSTYRIRIQKAYFIETKKDFPVIQFVQVILVMIRILTT